jgi:hypothetical protein
MIFARTTTDMRCGSLFSSSLACFDVEPSMIARSGFLRLPFLQAHLEIEAHFTATGVPSQRNRSDLFRLKRLLDQQENLNSCTAVATMAAALQRSKRVASTASSETIFRVPTTSQRFFHSRLSGFLNGAIVNEVDPGGQDCLEPRARTLRHHCWTGL